jgi:transcriptional regulator with XRE-family HTH domain
MKKIKCRCCAGSGLERDHAAVGSYYRKVRRAQKKRLKEVSGPMGISISHLSYLEKGKRRWTGKLEKACQQALGL